MILSPIKWTTLIVENILHWQQLKVFGRSHEASLRLNNIILFKTLRLCVFQQFSLSEFRLNHLNRFLKQVDQTKNVLD